MIPTPWTLQIKRAVITTNDRGEQIRTYGPPEDWPVHGYSPGDNALQFRQNRDESDIEWTVQAPTGLSLPAELDLVTIEGDDYLVTGRPDDWTHGPWDHPDAGVTVSLKRWEG